MTSSLLDISNKIDTNTLAVLRSVAGAAERLDIPMVVIGATARDMVLHHCYGAMISRATRDVDFAIQLPDWSAFEAFKAELQKDGFSATGIPHRLDSAQGGWIDLVPFGQISNDGKGVVWPPKGDVTMNILGFNEAYDHALQIRVHDAPAIDVRVVSPVGLALLKLVSWTERERENRPSDAKDLLYLCGNYWEIPSIENEMYGREKMMDAYGWVPELGSANLLGRDVRAIAASDTQALLEQLFSDKIRNRPLRELVRESCDKDSQFEENETRLSAFIDGYMSTW